MEAFRTLAAAKIPHAIASYRPIIDPSLAALELPADVVIVEAKGGLHGKPDPDLFFAGRDRLGVRTEECLVVGDAVWDQIGARRAGMLNVGVLTGGYTEEELARAGAFRIYRDIADLLHNLDELGFAVP